MAANPSRRQGVSSQSSTLRRRVRRPAGSLRLTRRHRFIQPTSPRPEALYPGRKDTSNDYSAHFNKDKVQYEKSHCGTIKTLSEGLPAWRAMGALAGELSYLSSSVSWDLYRAERQAHK